MIRYLLPDQGLRRRLVTLAVDLNTAPAHPGDSILHEGEVVGTITSAAWGYRTGLNLALGYVRPDLAEIGKTLQVQILDQSPLAKIVEPSQYDPKSSRVKS